MYRSTVGLQIPRSAGRYYQQLPCKRSVHDLTWLTRGLFSVGDPKCLKAYCALSYHNYQIIVFVGTDCCVTTVLSQIALTESLLHRAACKNGLTSHNAVGDMALGVWRIGERHVQYDYARPIRQWHVRDVLPRSVCWILCPVRYDNSVYGAFLPLLACWGTNNMCELILPRSRMCGEQGVQDRSSRSMCWSSACAT